MDLKKYAILALLIAVLVLGFTCLYCKDLFEPFVTTSALDAFIGTNPRSIQIDAEIKDIACSDTYIYIALEKTILVYDLTSLTKIDTITPNSEYEIIKLLVLPNNNNKLLVSFLDNRLTLYNTTDYSFTTKTYSDINIITNIQYNPTYEMIVTSCDNNTILLINSNTLENLKTIKTTYNNVYDNFITDALLDEDTLYFSSQFKLSKLKGDTVNHFPTHQRTSSVVKMNGKVYVGAIDGTIMQLDEYNAFTLFAHIPNSQIQRLLAVNDTYMIVSVILSDNSYSTYIYDTSNNTNNSRVVDREPFGNNAYYYNNRLIVSDNKNNIKIYNTQSPIITTTANKVAKKYIHKFAKKPIEITSTQQIVRPPTTQAPTPMVPPPVPTSAIKTQSIDPEYLILNIVSSSSEETKVTYSSGNKYWQGGGFKLHYDNDNDNVSLSEPSWVITGLNDRKYYFDHPIESNIKDIIGKYKWINDKNMVVEKYDKPDPSVTQTTKESNSIDTMKLGNITIYD
jgi:hypothetical protein